MVMNKKGQGMSTSTIVLLILGIIVLVALIFGFATGWQSFKKVLSPTNVDNILEDCGVACGLGSEFSYCSGERTLRVNEDKLEVSSSCAVFAGLAEFDKYKVADCPSINCDLKCDDITFSGKKDKKNLNVADYDFIPITGVDCSP